MNYDRNRFQRLFAYLRRVWAWGGAATVVLTIFNVAVHGPRHLLLHLGLHALRVPGVPGCLSLFVGPLALMFTLAFSLIWITYRPTTPADLVPVSGTVAEYGRDDEDRFVIVLNEYDNVFLPHAEIPSFDTKHFAREITPGDRVHFLLHHDRQAELNNGDLLTVFAIRSDRTTFVDQAAALAAEHHDRSVVVSTLR